MVGCREVDVRGCDTCLKWTAEGAVAATLARIPGLVEAKSLLFLPLSHPFHQPLSNLRQFQILCSCCSLPNWRFRSKRCTSAPSSVGNEMLRWVQGLEMSQRIVVIHRGRAMLQLLSGRPLDCLLLVVLQLSPCIIPEESNMFLASVFRSAGLI